MFCPKCGFNNSNDAAYCVKCGACLKTESPEKQPCPHCGIQTVSHAKISNHLVMAILTTLFCCIPLGIVGIIFAVKTDAASKAGNVELAKKYSDKAFTWNMWGIVLGLIFTVIFSIFQFMVVAAQNV